MSFLYCCDLFLQTIEKNSYSLSHDNMIESWLSIHLLELSVLSPNVCSCNLQTKCKTVKFIQARNINLPLSDQDSHQFITLMYALPQHKSLLKGL